MRRFKIETIMKHLSRKNYHIEESWLRDNEDRAPFLLTEYIPIVCNECGYTRAVTIGTIRCSNKSPCPQCLQQRKLDKKFGAGHVKILEYNGVSENSKLYCTHTEQVFEKRIFNMMSKSPCICNTKLRHYDWKEIEELAIARGYKLLDHEDEVKVDKKAKFLCSKHGVFISRLYYFLKGSGCPECNNVRRRAPKEEAQARIDEVHGAGRYLLGDDYRDLGTSCTITCGSCNQKRFVRPSDVIHRGSRCSCETNISHGEAFLNGFLDYMGLHYEKQFRFDDCRYKKPLPFDFKVWNHDNTWFLLEFDGIQHFKKVPRWGGKENLKTVQLHDRVKDEYCEKNKIFLIRVQNKKRHFNPDDQDRVVEALERAGAMMSFLSHLEKHRWVIRVEM